MHEAFGWRDREAEIPMENGSVFCVRSMTKPLIGTSILMLVEEGLLQFDDKISQYLPSFGVEGTRDITIEQLLTHSSSCLAVRSITAGGISASADGDCLCAVGDCSPGKPFGWHLRLPPPAGIGIGRDDDRERVARTGARVHQG